MEYTTEQKRALRGMIEQPMVMDALTDALRGVHKDKGEAHTLEAAAMAYSYTQGAGKLLEHLFRLCESTKSIQITPRRLKHTPQ